MSWWWLLFVPMLITVLVALIQDLFSYLRCGKYKNQGFVQRFTLLLGSADMYFPDRSDNSAILSRFKEILASIGSAPGLVVNTYPRGRAKIFLRDPALIHEFFLKDHIVSKKHEFSEAKCFYNEYFPFATGKQAEEERASFKNFFRREKLEEVFPSLQRDVCNHIKRVEDAAKSSGTWTDGVFVANWQEPNLEFLNHVANTMIFGQSDEPIRVPSEGNRFFGKVLMEYLDGPYVATLNSTLNKLFCGLPQKLKLLKSARRAEEMKSTLISILESEFRVRTSDPVYKPRHCILDVRGNLRSSGQSAARVCPTEVLFKEAAIYMISGMNTVKRSLNGMLYNLAIHRDIADKIYEELHSHGLGLGSTTPLTMEKLESLPYLEAYLKESMRLLPIFYSSFSRLLLQDFNLGKYKFYKGDVVDVPYISQYFREEFFPNANKFDPDRFIRGLDKSVPPMAFTPFGTGGRVCIGRGLAEAVTKLFMVQMLQRFEISLPPGVAIATWTESKGEFTRTNYTVVCTPRKSS